MDTVDRDSSPLVTTIIPSFNHARYIEQAIESVLQQTYDNIELIISDDGSTDNTVDVLTKYESHPRIRLLKHSVNRGQSVSINAALSIAKGEYISFLPSDDWYLPHKTEMQLSKFLECAPSVGVVYGRGARSFECSGQIREMDLPLLKGNVARRILGTGNFVYPVTPLYRKECFDRFPFDERYKAEGESIFAKLALAYEFDFVDDIVAVMRDHEENTGKNVELMYRENIDYWSDFFATMEMPDELRKLRATRLGRIHRLKGLELIRICGQPKAGRMALLKAIGCRTSYLLDPRIIAGIVLSFLPPAAIVRLLERQ
ncbi:MAG: glycosyltransferase [Rhodopirellula sp.]|nr:glycosyltransferase [Rhodopirellula sp.]